MWDEYISAGVRYLNKDPEAILNYTQYELDLMLDGFEWRKTFELNKAIYGAWHTALFVWQKKLPDLNDALIKEKEEVKEVSLEEKTLGILARLGVPIIDASEGDV